jgi:hypothetical protein
MVIVVNSVPAEYLGAMWSPAYLSINGVLTASIAARIMCVAV